MTHSRNTCDSASCTICYPQPFSSKPLARRSGQAPRPVTGPDGDNQIKKRRRHGHSYSETKRPTPTYRTWVSMMSRCFSVTAANYRLYGGRGIKVCERWHMFENFLADMGERPPRTSLDRIDASGHYEPGNCRWATASEQASNRRPTSEWSVKPGSFNRTKTHCKHGHELSGDNLRTYSGRRVCRACLAIHCKNYRKRKKESR